MKMQIGEWIYDPHAQTLAQDGQFIRLEPRVAAVLGELIEARGGVVGKDQLLEKVWAGAYVSDHSVATAVSKLRSLLKDDRGDPRYIETLPKRGYRLVSPARPLCDEGAEGPRAASGRGRRGWWVAVAIAAAMVAAALFMSGDRQGRERTPRLYFTGVENLSGDESLGLSASAAAEMLTVALADGKRRLIRWRTEQGGSVDGARRNDLILSGALVRDGEETVLLMNLADAEDGATIWGRRYGFESGRLTDVATDVTNALSGSLGPFPNVDAYQGAEPGVLERYWQARFLWSLRRDETVPEARRILLDVVERAPDFAPAYAALADLYAHKTHEELGVLPTETYPTAQRYLDRALALDPDLSEAFVTRAHLAFFRDRNYEAAAAAIRRAIELRSDNALAWQSLAMIQGASGRPVAALESLEKARFLDPLSISIVWDKVWLHYLAGDFEKALVRYNDALTVSEPPHVYGVLINLALARQADATAAWLRLAEARGMSSEDRAALQEVAETGGFSEFAKAMAQSARDGQGYEDAAVSLAAILASAGLETEAVDLLAPNAPGEKSWWWNWYAVIPALAPVRGDPRLAVVSARYAL